MTRAPDWLRDPTDLIAFLRERGLLIGSAEALRVAAVIDRLERDGRAPTGVDSAVPILAPLLTTTAAGQETLPQLLAAFAAEIGESAAQASDEFSIPSAAPPRSSDVSSASDFHALPSVRRWLLSAVAIVVTVWIVWGAWTGLAQTEYFVKAGDSAPLSSGSSFVKVLLAGLNQLGGLRFAVIPWLAYLLFRRWNRSRPTRLRRLEMPAQQGRVLHGLTGDEPSLFGEAELRQPLQSLRSHRREPSNELDVASSVRATVAAAGQPTLLPGTRSRLPDYPLIIEQLSSKDYAAVLGRAISARLVDEQVEHSVYTYATDPANLRNKNNGNVRLNDLATLHGEEAVLVVSDGSGFIDPLTGGLKRAAKVLLTYKYPVLLTPVPLDAWEMRETALFEAGFIVLPATTAGLKALCEFVRRGDNAARPLGNRLSDPDPIGGALPRGHVWLQERSPPDSERKTLLADLALNLPGSAFEFMCILALFPQIRIDLTFAAGMKLRDRDDRPLLNDETFSALACLPWFRYGRMPEWLRLALAECIAPSRLTEARTFMAEWLGGFAGPVATQAIRREAARDPSSILRDPIFLTFTGSESRQPLNLEAPARLASLLRPKWLALEWLTLIAVALLSLGGFVYSRALTAALPAIGPTAFAYPFVVFGLVSVIMWHLQILVPQVPRVLLQPLLFAVGAYGTLCLSGRILPVYEIGFAIIALGPLSLAMVERPLAITPLKWPQGLRLSYADACGIGVALCAFQKLEIYPAGPMDLSPSFPLYAAISSLAISHYFQRASRISIFTLFPYAFVGAIGAVLPVFAGAVVFGPQFPTGLGLSACVIGSTYGASLALWVRGRLAFHPVFKLTSMFLVLLAIACIVVTYTGAGGLASSMFRTAPFVLGYFLCAHLILTLNERVRIFKLATSLLVFGGIAFAAALLVDSILGSKAFPVPYIALVAHDADLLVELRIIRVSVAPLLQMLLLPAGIAVLFSRKQLVEPPTSFTPFPTAESAEPAARIHAASVEFSAGDSNGYTYGLIVGNSVITAWAPISGEVVVKLPGGSRQQARVGAYDEKLGLMELRIGAEATTIRTRLGSSSASRGANVAAVLLDSYLLGRVLGFSVSQHEVVRTQIKFESPRNVELGTPVIDTSHRLVGLVSGYDKNGATLLTPGDVVLAWLERLRMPVSPSDPTRRMIVCLDDAFGIEGNTNVLKLFSMLNERSHSQRVFYRPILRTAGPAPGVLTAFREQFLTIFDLLSGNLVEKQVQDAYAFLSKHYEAGDQIWIFGVGRGALAARILAGMIHKVGLTNSDSAERVSSAWSTYIARDNLDLASRFRETFARRASIKFLGLWDTASTFGLLRSARRFPYIHTNLSVNSVAHAVSLDERRSLYSANLWNESGTPGQNVQQVWFPGVHSDVVGGYPEAESGLSKIALAWMVGQAEAYGVEFDRQSMQKVLPSSSNANSAAADPKAMLHDPLRTLVWRLLPKRARIVPDGAWLHPSIRARWDADPRYRPSNLPAHYTIAPEREIPMSATTREETRRRV